MQLRGAPVLDVDGRPRGRRDPVELGPSADLGVYEVDLTVDRRPATPEELARLAPVTATRAEIPAYNRPRPARNGSWRNYRSVMGAAAPAPLEDPVTIPAGLPVLPCGDCLHDPVCALKASLGEEPLNAEPHYFAPGLRAIRAVLRIECDHQLTSLRQVEPEPIRAEHGGESWRTVTPPTTSIAAVRASSPAEFVRASRQRGADRMRKITDERIIELLREHGGNRNRVALAAGVAHATIRRRVEAICDRGDMPPEIAATLTSKPGTRRRQAVSA